MFLTIFALISVYEYPLEPVQFFLWETFFIGIPAFFLALQPNKDRIKGSFIGGLASKSLPGAFILFLSAMACYVFSIKTNNLESISTLISFAVTFGGFFILLNLCMPLDKFRSVVVFGCLICSLLVLILLPSWVFGYVKLLQNSFVFLIICWVLTFLLYYLLMILIEKLYKNKKI